MLILKGKTSKIRLQIHYPISIFHFTQQPICDAMSEDQWFRENWIKAYFVVKNVIEIKSSTSLHSTFRYKPAYEKYATEMKLLWVFDSLATATAQQQRAWIKTNAVPCAIFGLSFLSYQKM